MLWNACKQPWTKESKRFMSTTNYSSNASKRSPEIPTRPNRSILTQAKRSAQPVTGSRKQLVLAGTTIAGERLLDRLAEERKRRTLILLLINLSMVFVILNGLMLQYLRLRVPLPEMLPEQVHLNYPPHYVFSMYGVDRPVSVAVSPVTDLIYVAEMDGGRMIKMFDSNGHLLGSFTPPRTNPPERSPVYLAASADGRVFVSDRAQHAIFVFDAQGNYLDTILSPTLTLSEYISKHTGGLPPGTTFSYNIFQTEVYYQKPGESEQTLPAPDMYDWAPLGLRFDRQNRLIVTDVGEDHSYVQIIPENVISSQSWEDFEPVQLRFGSYGKENGEMIYPNSAVIDTNGRVYVSDGNNSRISVWDAQGEFMFNFGRGTGNSALNLPRGMVIDEKDRLYIVDAVGQSIKVYDVSKDEVSYLFAFGDFGADDGQFNYPNDVSIDKTGKLYIVDRENNRIQVWLY